MTVKFGTRKPQVYSENARDEAKLKIHRIKNQLEDIEVQMGKYESLQAFHYGHVGDLGHILELLDQAYEFMCYEAED